MYERAMLMFLYANSPLHFGAGVSLGAVDLPVQRERHTGYPMAQGSGLKGAIRHHVESSGAPGDRTQKAQWVFGPDGERAQANAHAGAVAFGDGRLLLFPVRSLVGTFAYCTSVVALGRLRRDAAMAGSVDWQVPAEPGDATAWVTTPKVVADGKVVLEDFDLRAEERADVRQIAEWIAASAVADTPAFAHFRERIKTHLVVLPDDLFAHLTRLATVVEPHVKINDETGAAEGTAFFYAEHLPPDSLLWSLVGVGRPRVRRNGGEAPDLESLGIGDADGVARWLKQELDGKSVQAGAEATTGRGLVHVRLV